MALTEITKSTGLSMSPETTSTGEIAAEAFTRFDRGVAPDEVVTELALPVDTVEYLWRTWARLRCAMPLSLEAARSIRETLFSNRPIANGGDAVAAVRRFVERPLKPCPRCKDGAREYCTTCPAKEATRVARGTVRRSAQRARSQQSRAGLPRGVETAPAREGDAFSDTTARADPSGFAETAYPAPSKEPR